MAFGAAAGGGAAALGGRPRFRFGGSGGRGFSHSCIVVSGGGGSDIPSTVQNQVEVWVTRFVTLLRRNNLWLWFCLWLRHYQLDHQGLTGQLTESCLE